MRCDYNSLYIAFDPHPSYKGASTHIDQMCDVLSRVHPPLLLLTLKSNLQPVQTGNIHQVCFESDEPNLLKRATDFTNWAIEILSNQHNLVMGHFRDIWGGMAVLQFPHIHPVFEVNGLPSIELPYRYSEISTVTIDKIRNLENHCLKKAAVIITPSHTTKKCLLSRSCDDRKITVIPNGAHVSGVLPRDKDLPEKYIVYAGALQPWQGADVLMKALRYLEDLRLPLVICSSYTEHHAKPYRKFATKLGVEEKIIWKYQLEKDHLYSILQHALCSVAPLIECSRNVEQGCSPLKILESMACGTPVIASKIPAVEEIITDGHDGILCRPGRPADLARAIRLAADYPERTIELGGNAKLKIERHFTWYHAKLNLEHLYHSTITFSC